MLSCQIFIERKTTVKIGFTPAKTLEIKNCKWNTQSYTYRRTDILPENVAIADNIFHRNLTEHTWKDKIKYVTMETMRKESIKHFQMIITQDSEHCPLCCLYKVK